MQTILITGGTGMIGKKLTQHLAGKAYNIIILTRKMPVSKNSIKNVEYALWDVDKQTIDTAAIQKADHIIHLAGAGVVDKKWTEKYKKEIVDSRINSSALLIAALKNNSNHVKSVTSASAIGWYGEDPAPLPGGFTEKDKADPGFLGETCRQWEESIEPATALGKRVVKVRTGIVLGNDGGALAEFKRPVKFGIAAILGSGKQIVSWIHIDDLCRIFMQSIENENMNGSYNGVAPLPVSNKILTLELAKKMKGRFYVPLHVPPLMLKIILGTRSIEVLKSTTVSCEKIKSTGFTFLYTSIEAALKQLCNE